MKMMIFLNMMNSQIIKSIIKDYHMILILILMELIK